MKILTDICSSDEIQNLIGICKSDSNKTGKELKKAHYRLGELLGSCILQDLVFNENVTVISLLRSGICFGDGIADALNCTHLFLDEKHDKRWLESGGDAFIMEYKKYILGHTVILADAVINSGETIQKVYDTISVYVKNVIIAANVIQDAYNPCDKNVFCVRVSNNKFQGSKVKIQMGDYGPDTGDRLFQTF